MRDDRGKLRRLIRKNSTLPCVKICFVSSGLLMSARGHWAVRAQRLIEQRQGCRNLDADGLVTGAVQVASVAWVGGAPAICGEGSPPRDPEVRPPQRLRSGVVLERLRIALRLLPGARVKRGLHGEAVRPEVIVPDGAPGQQRLALGQRLGAAGRLARRRCELS